jgi:hypothetical protein
MTSFQSLSFSGGCGISTRGQVLCRHSAPVLHDNESGHPVFTCGDSRCFIYFQEKSICFLKQKAIGRRLIL